jgi:hypothetical protein
MFGRDIIPSKPNFSLANSCIYRRYYAFSFIHYIPLLHDKNLVELRIDQTIKFDGEAAAIRELFKSNDKIRDVQLSFSLRKHLYCCFKELKSNYVIKSAIFTCDGGIDKGNLSFNQF